MAAIITDDFRRNQARLLVNDIKASASGSYETDGGGDESQWPYRGNNRYSVGLGKSDPWEDNAGSIDEDNVSFVVPAPVGSTQEVHDVVSNLFTLKDVAASGVEQLIAKNEWQNGRKYKVYDQTDNDMFYASGDLYPCAVTYDNKVFLCLSNTALQGGFTAVSGSTTAPDASDYGVSTPDNQGYVWAHVATIDPNDPLTTTQFVPINQSPGLQPAQKEDTGGLLTHIGVVDGGTNYSDSTTTVTISLVGANGNELFNSEDSPNIITAVPVISNGVITRIDLRDPNGSNPTDAGSYEYWTNQASTFLDSNVVNRVASATITISDTGSGSGAKAYASVAPLSGFGENAIDILPTWFVGVNVDFEGLDVDEDAPDLKFRQVSLIKNFTRNDDGDTDSSILDALKYIEVSNPNSSNITALTTGDILTGDNSGAKFYYDYYDSPNLYYHQNSNNDVNMISPNTNDNITAVSGGSAIGGVTSVNAGEYDIFNSPANLDKRNGEVIFHENRKPFARGSSQTEEVKLIIQL